MRLIDADKLKLEQTARIQLGEMQEYFALISYSKKQIDEAPTVEAIPIEWIVKWAWGFMDKNSEGYKMAMELLHDWEKENDR